MGNYSQRQVTSEHICYTFGTGNLPTRLKMDNTVRTEITYRFLKKEANRCRRIAEGDTLAVYKTEGIVLRTRDLGEADRIVTLYTSERGKVDAVARGARKVKSRMAGAIQGFTLGHYMIFPGRTLDRLTQAHIIESMVGVREDLIKFAYGSYATELTDVMTMPGEPSDVLFQLLRSTLKALDTQNEPDIIVRRFEMCLMDLSGYAPHLDSCVRCGTDLAPPLRLSVAEGGLLCPACITADHAIIRVTPATVKWMTRLLQTPVERLGVFRLSGEEQRLLTRVLRAYVDFRLPRPLKSVAFLNSLQDLA